MSGGGGQQGAAAPAQGQMGQGAAQPQGGGMPQQQPQINPQTIQDIQNMIQQYQSGQLGGAQRGFAFGGPTNTAGGFAPPAPPPAPAPAAGPNIYGGGVNPNMAQTFAPQSPMGAFPQPPQGGGPDMTGMAPGSNMGYDRSGSDAGIGGRPVMGVQSPLSGMQRPGAMAMQGNKPLSLPQIRPQQRGLQIAGNPNAQPVMRGRGMMR